jgi:glycolate oxidase FAD binding subunit
MNISTPDTEEAVAQIVRDAHDAASPLELAGGETRRGLGRPVQAAQTLSVAGLNGVTLYEPGELTLVAQAGMTISALTDLLDGENQQLTFEPCDMRALLGTSGEPTLGGAIATGASGPRRLRMGAGRDAILGLRYVNGQGEILRAGGRVMKNVTGYDIPKLMCGAFGTLGVITEIGLKVMPKSEIVRTLALPGLSDMEAIGALSTALRMPCDVSGAAHLPASVAKELGFTDATTLLRVEGFETQADYRTHTLRDGLSMFGDLAPVDSDPWVAIRDAMFFAGDDRAVWRVSMKASDAPAYVAALCEGMDVEAFYDWGGGLVWLACAQGDDAAEPMIRATLAEYSGHATLVRANETIRAAVPVFQPEPAAIARLSTGLREKFDPAGILNPHRMRA